MNDEEIEYNKEMEEIKNSYPIIDFIETIPVNSFELHGKIQFIYY